MKVIQGCYTGKIESGKGKLKGLRIATEQGDEKVYLPKVLRAIAQAELTLNEPVRVWFEWRSLVEEKALRATASAADAQIYCVYGDRR